MTDSTTSPSGTVAMHVYHDATYNDTGLSGNTLTKADDVARSLCERPIEGVELVAPRPVTLDELRLVHSPEYIAALVDGDPSHLAGSNGIGWTDRLLDAVRASTGGVVAASLRALADRTVAGSLSSGLHHARRNTGEGFCTVNGLALAAVIARQQGARRVLILDLDAHCGGGTAHIIDGRSGIEQLDVSVSSFDQYTSTANARLVLADGHDYLAVVERELERIVDPAGIDLVVYNAGMDPHHGAGGVRGIDAAVLADREAMVFEWCAGHGVPVAWVLAGGYTYGVTIDELVDLHRLTIEAAVAARPIGSR